MNNILSMLTKPNVVTRPLAAQRQMRERSADLKPRGKADTFAVLTRFPSDQVVIVRAKVRYYSTGISDLQKG